MQTQPNINTPHSTKKKWQIWWQLTRPHTLTAAFVPVLLGSALAIYETSIDAGLFIAMMVASLFLQIATNMFNEYYDFKRGNDTAESVGIGGAIVREGIKPHVVLNSALGLYGASILIGIYICMNSSWWLAAVGLLGMAIGYLYTGGPLPIAYTPFGEIISGFVMGMLLILISFFIQTGTVTTTSVLVAIPSLLLVGGIMLSNNIRDLDGDKEFGRKTLAILIGRPKAVKLLATMFIVSYIWVFILIVMQIVSPWLALVVLSAPKPINAIKGFKGKTIAYEMVPAMKNTAQTNTVFGLLLSIGLLIGYIL
ncbi:MULTISPECIES: 1,4-dihydroxy-2-naphthoate polyprenyltransferase [Cytobacillus]|uniref:1,4-dihydroxy-2-naphthoate polyprenyltransferase n=1 Tax=Cytobacillus TaxID=2675230 RepID=UPI001CD47311|nr:1,4-dihydroxy-2-naphthoate polyprenyltransferase [Cytobacillus kochii]MCA1028805.1 1,4-dihydroxy-2-naphthoate polyprenyltransferase [Cytobacillus kochii]MCM3322929.1 1,4-dihydroxy-2-naphthoate polyprenyltransferase [Cytobacillus kochii]MCM3345325.1 1,4-dihydroxy-2-naphthoate polyprenyltransferase [Cytobacillus kochii]MDM5208936.1 1,4-dihydroxy-2-naphthoate polyprenyltransferase [Cytobacillus kochii]